MRNPKDPRTKILPSTTRRGKELPSSFALDSPSVLSKLATPTHAIDSDRSHAIDDATFALHNECLTRCYLLGRLNLLEGLLGFGVGVDNPQV